MIHFLRNKNNKTIIETEVFHHDVFEVYLTIITSILPKNYGLELFHIYETPDVYKKEAYDFMQDIQELSELKELYFNKFINATENEFNDVVKSKYKKVAEKYNLKYVED